MRLLPPGNPVYANEVFVPCSGSGLPAAICSDNRLPFASPNGLYDLSRPSVFWLRLGITEVDRACPGPDPGAFGS
jgi:hypothetical protein